MIENNEEKIYVSPKLQKALNIYSRALDNINKFAYNDIYLLSNGVLSRNPYGSDLLKNIFINKLSQKISRVRVFINIMYYYVKSFALFILWLIQKVFFNLSGYRQSKNSQPEKELILLDTFFVTKNIENNGFRDKAYLRGLDILFEDESIKFSYLPMFYGSKNPLDYRDLFRSLKKQQKIQQDYITDHEMLTMTDVFKIIKFIFCYPFHVMQLAKYIDNSLEVNLVIKNELLATLNQVTWPDYARYLLGRRVGKTAKKIKLISWCEYQTINKGLYKGIRETCDSVTIYGCQFFIQFGNWVNVKIPNSEIKYQVTPDIVLVNGTANIDETSLLDYKVGPSLRYKSIFQPVIESSLNHTYDVLVLLSYLSSESERMLKLISKSEFTDRAVGVKLHPALNPSTVKRLMRPSWEIVGGDLYEQLKKTNIVIVTASGTAVEAATMGKSVIIISNNEGLTTNPMLNLGKGVIWDFADTAAELSIIKDKLLNIRVKHPDKVSEISRRYKKLLFTDLSKTEILSQFDLL